MFRYNISLVIWLKLLGVYLNVVFVLKVKFVCWIVNKWWLKVDWRDLLVISCKKLGLVFVLY